MSRHAVCPSDCADVAWGSVLVIELTHKVMTKKTATKLCWAVHSNGKRARARRSLCRIIVRVRTQRAHLHIRGDDDKRRDLIALPHHRHNTSTETSLRRWLANATHVHAIHKTFNATTKRVRFFSYSIVSMLHAYVHMCATGPRQPDVGHGDIDVESRIRLNACMHLRYTLRVCGRDDDITYINYRSLGK